jgi:hypothetical protein
MLNIFHRNKLKRGDLVEITLTTDAILHRGAYDSYSKDSLGGINIPGRIHAGYVIAVEDHYISLARGWNKQTNMPENGETRFYSDARQSCKKK